MCTKNKKYYEAIRYLLLNNIVVDDGRSITSTFSQQTTTQLKVIKDLLLLEVANLNELVMNTK